MESYKCLSCSKSFDAFPSQHKKYCDTKCQNEFQYREFIKKWKLGEHDGMRGKTSTSHHIRKYLFEKYNNSCCECGWSKTNLFTNKIPLELEHIDGNFANNIEDNLKLLCSNCHSLTSTWKGANKKQGRPRAKYYRGV
jgi:DNA-directed RNA polymerase subunit RPC12/RpoP